MKKLRFCIFSLVLLLFGFAILMVAGLYLWGHEEMHTVARWNLGNQEEMLARLKELEPRESEVSFLVMGDPRGHETFEQVCKVARRDRQLDFIIILGDFAANPFLPNHEFFIAEVNERHLRVPVFVVAGNHDIYDPEEPVKKIPRKVQVVGPSEFEEMYGKRNFSFSFRGHRFIFLDDASVSRTEWKEFLKTELGRDAEAPGTKTFVFCHRGPVLPTWFEDLKEGRHAQDVSEWMEKITKEKADYVIAGDYHGYYREKRGKCTYLVTGGGGSNLKPKIYGRFHHGVKISVREDGSVAEDILEVEKKIDIEDGLEYWALIYVHPFLNGYPVAGVAFLVFCGVGAFGAGWGALVSLSPKRKRKTSGDSGARGQDVERELSPRTTGGSR